jgi:hypothetical protein
VNSVIDYWEQVGVVVLYHPQDVVNEGVLQPTCAEGDMLLD